MPAPRPRPISDILPRFQNVAQSSHYLVKFALPYSQTASGLRSFLRRKGVNDRFVGEDAGLLCSDAVLPGSALASIDTRGDFQGVIERFAHTRNFTQIQLEFYVDNEYKSMKFLEHWMEYVTGANTNLTSDAYHFTLNYPESYKSNETKIIKFERDYNRFLEYRFIGLFPLALNSTRVSYQGSQVLKASGLTQSTSEARRLVAQKGIKIDGQTIADEKMSVKKGDTFVIQVGKRRFKRVVVS